MPDDVGALDAQRFQQQEQILRLRAFVGVPSGSPKPARVVTNDPVSALERRNLIIPDADVVRPAVNENDRRSFPRDIVIDGRITDIERACLRITNTTHNQQQNQEPRNLSHRRLPLTTQTSPALRSPKSAGG